MTKIHLSASPLTSSPGSRRLIRPAPTLIIDTFEDKGLIFTHGVFLTVNWQRDRDLPAIETLLLALVTRLLRKYSSKQSPPLSFFIQFLADI